MQYYYLHREITAELYKNHYLKEITDSLNWRSYGESCGGFMALWLEKWECDHRPDLEGMDYDCYDDEGLGYSNPEHLSVYLKEI